MDRVTKRCSHCHEHLPLERFGRYDRAVDGRKYVCKPCIKVYRGKLRAEGKITPGGEQRFWGKVEKTDECWLYRGGITTDGYGRFYYGGKDVPAHHMPMIFAGQEPPKFPMVSDHLCKTRNCVRWPDHIRIVHQGVNTLENSNSCWAKNKAKTHCGRCGGPLSGENIARLLRTYPSGRSGIHRMCLTCWPSYRNNPARIFDTA